MNAAIVVAHPDDEIIWCGGLLLRHPDWTWTVLALCRGDDADRGPKFHRVCKHLGVRGFLSDLDDGAPPASIDPVEEIGPRVTGRLGDATWDLLLTHGRNGEYGHPRHVQTHGVIAALVKDKTLACRRFWTFGCEAHAPDGRCAPAPWADLTLALTEAELAEKRRIVRDMYGYPENGFEVRACVSPEAYFRMKDDDKGLVL